jgi:hypothetical protein
MKTKVMVALAFAGIVSTVLAADDPTGTWKWTEERGGQQRERTLKLKVEGDKLTGSILGRDNQENPIADGSFKDGKVSFSYTREFNGQRFTSKYAGTISGDSIKGKVESQRDGQTQSADWNAKRQK